MLRQNLTELTIVTSGRGFYQLTPQVEKLLFSFGIKEGLATLHIQHTSASLLIQENADPDVTVDLESYFSRLVQDGDPAFRHREEGDDDMSAHIRTALTCVNLSVPIKRGRLALGTWQTIYLWEHRFESHRRQVMVHLLGE